MCFNVQGQFGWSCELPGLVEGGGGMPGALGSLPTNPLCDSKGSPGIFCSPTWESPGRKQSHVKKKIRTCWDFLSFLCNKVLAEQWETSIVLLITPETHLSGKPQELGVPFQFWFALPFFCHYFLCFQLTLILPPPKKRNKLETILCLILQWKSELQGVANDSFKQHRRFLFVLQMQLHI